MFGSLRLKFYYHCSPDFVPEELRISVGNFFVNIIICLAFCLVLLSSFFALNMAEKFKFDGYTNFNNMLVTEQFKCLQSDLYIHFTNMRCHQVLY